jgi:hypothetical protein
MQRNGQKTRQTKLRKKNDPKKSFPPLLCCEKLSTWTFFQTVFLWYIWTPLAEKRTKTKQQQQHQQQQQQQQQQHQQQQQQPQQQQQQQQQQFVSGRAFTIGQAAQRAPKKTQTRPSRAPRAHGVHAPTAGATATPQRSSRRRTSRRDPCRRRTRHPSCLRRSLEHQTH